MVGKRGSRAFHNWCGWLNLTGTAKVTTRMARGLNGRWNTGTKGTVGKRIARTFIALRLEDLLENFKSRLPGKLWLWWLSYVIMIQQSALTSFCSEYYFYVYK
eukprot:scaffold42943_cov53-Attheya_sp.AAC.1